MNGFYAFKRRKVMRPSYINNRLEDLAHDISVVVWILCSPRSTTEQLEKGLRMLQRFTKRLKRYNAIKDNGGMEKHLARYDEIRFNDFVSAAERMMEG